MENRCEYIFIRGNRARERCTRRIFYWRFCRRHFRPFYDRWTIDRDINPFNGRPISLAMRNEMEQLNM